MGKREIQAQKRQKGGFNRSAETEKAECKEDARGKGKKQCAKEKGYTKEGYKEQEKKGNGEKGYSSVEKAKAIKGLFSSPDKGPAKSDSIPVL